MKKTAKRSASWVGDYAKAFRHFISSDTFFILILVLAGLQGLWYILSINLFWFDEIQHFNFTRMYAERLSPFITEQPEQWDSLGEITRNPNYLFYYLMSFPYRFLDLFTDSTITIAIGMRMIMMAFFLAGMYLYRRVFLAVGASRAVANIALLVVIMVPGFAPLAGAYNYDSVIFFLTPLLILFVLRMMRASKPNVSDLVWFFLIGFLGSLIKFSFMAIFIPAAIFALVYFGFFSKPGAFFKRIGSYLSSLRFGVGVLVLVAVIGAMALFFERSVQNVVVYGHWHPNCVEFVGEERCRTNYTWRRNIDFLEVRPDEFRPLSPAHYLLGLWMPGMMNTSSTPVYNRPPTLGMEMVGMIAFFLVLLALAIDAKSIWADKRTRLIYVLTLTYLVILFLTNYRGYIYLGQPIAIAARYFLPVAPILLFFAVRTYFPPLFRRFQWTALLAVPVFLVLYAQGAGIVSFMHNKQDDAYWKDDGIVIEVNEPLTNFLEEIVIQKSGFRRI